MNLNQKLENDFVNSTGIFADGHESLPAADLQEYKKFIAAAEKCHAALKGEPDQREWPRLTAAFDENIKMANGILQKHGIEPVKAPERELSPSELEAQDDAAVSEMLALANDPGARKGGVE